MFFGFLSATCCGLGLPSFVFLFGDIADSFALANPKETLDSIITTSKLLVVIGIGVWALAYFFFTFFIISSERIGQKTRIKYLQAVLSQDIAWFDQINTATLSQRLGKECQAI